MKCQPVELCNEAKTVEQRDIVRSNWEKLGYEQWFTDYNLEYWRPVGYEYADKCIILVTE